MRKLIDALYKTLELYECTRAIEQDDSELKILFENEKQEGKFQDLQFEDFYAKKFKQLSEEFAKTYIDFKYSNRDADEALSFQEKCQHTAEYVELRILKAKLSMILDSQNENKLSPIQKILTSKIFIKERKSQQDLPDEFLKILKYVTGYIDDTESVLDENSFINQSQIDELLGVKYSSTVEIEPISESVSGRKLYWNGNLKEFTLMFMHLCNKRMLSTYPDSKELTTPIFENLSKMFVVKKKNNAPYSENTISQHHKQYSQKDLDEYLGGDSLWK